MFQSFIRGALVALFMLGTVAEADYHGFKKPKKGEWIDMVINNSRMQLHQKILFLGNTTMNKKTVYGIEMKTQPMQIIMQSWAQKKEEGGAMVKAVMRMGGQLICISGDDPSMQEKMGKIPDINTPETFDPRKHKPTRYTTYTTPTGKKVSIAIYKTDGKGETWVSSEVPFGIVKMTDNNGQLIAHLHDFGNDGKPVIAIQQAKECQPMNLGQMLGGMMGGAPQGGASGGY